MHDLLIRNALLLDGLGSAPVRGDLAVKDGRIAGVGSVLSDQKHWKEGLAAYERAQRIDRALLPADDLQQVPAMIGRARAMVHLDMLQDAARGYQETVALMDRAGVLTSVNSDSDELARRLNLDAAKAMKYGGLSEEEALKLCTLNGAKQLRLDHRIGSIDAGKDADVVIWNGHPFSTYSRVDTTFVEGEIVFDRQRDIAQRAALAKEKADRLKKEADDEKKNKPAKKDEEKSDE